MLLQATEAEKKRIECTLFNTGHERNEKKKVSSSSTFSHLFSDVKFLCHCNYHIAKKSFLFFAAMTGT